MKKTVKQYCSELSWSISELARRAGLSWQAAQNAYYREPIMFRTKFEICKAFGQTLGHVVQVHEVQWDKEQRWQIR